MFIAIAYFLGRFVTVPFVLSRVVRSIGLLLTFIGFLLGIDAAVAPFYMRLAKYSDK